MGILQQFILSILSIDLTNRFSIKQTLKKMPKVKRGNKLPPDGWELIEPTLDELHRKMREGSITLDQ